MKRSFKKVASFISVLLVIAIVCASMPFIMAESDNPLEVTISTDKSRYTLMDEMTFTATVKNTGNRTVKNISAQALFGASLLGIEEGSTFFVDKPYLEPGESFSFSYRGEQDSFSGLDVLFLPFVVFVSMLRNNTFYRPEDIIDETRAFTEETKEVSLICFSSSSYDSTTTVKVYYTDELNDDTPDQNSDTDRDGIPKSLEDLLGISDGTNDSDNDGISDYKEIYEIGSDPSLVDSNDDYDSDRISNADEINIYGTSAVKEDTDSDNLTDYQEIFEYKTSPLKYDTDGDGVSDGKEMELETNPNAAEFNFIVEQTSDCDDTVTASVEIELSGEQVETLIVNPVDDNNLFPEDMPGYLGQAYEFSVEGSFDDAVINFEFDESNLDEGAEPTIYYFNEETQELEELKTTITGNVASTTVTHFSKYILIDRKIYDESFTWTDVWDANQKYTSVEIVLVIDDSGSLGGDYDYDSSKGIFLGGKDPEHKRLEVARDFVDNANDNAKIGIVKFDGVIDNLTGDLIECNDEGKQKLKDYLKFTYKYSGSYNISGIFDSRGYTYMYEGIKKAINLFSESSEEETMKVIVVFTDGEAHDTQYHTSVVNSAVEKNIKIYTVGLGTSSSYFDRYLKPLASNTGGSFYYASDAEQLEDIYENISNKIDIETDSDADGIPDYYEDNMICFNGVRMTLDKNNPDSDGDGLLDGEEIELKYEYNEDRSQVKVTGKLVLGNPIESDTDFDGISDKEDALPTQNKFTGTLKMSGTSPRIEYTMDYRNFFEDNKKFNSELSRASLIFSAVMYENGPMNYDDKFGLADSTWNEVILSNHMDDVVEYKLNKEVSNGKVTFDKYYDDDISEVLFGHKRVEYNGEIKEIIAVFVRGTNGTIEEWSSNFDIGDLNKFSQYDDWTNSKNHKGFDVTATRIERALEEYIDTYITYYSRLSYWVTGHSRGAAIANIISANLINNAEEVFAYTFATPNTTTDSNANASKYGSIFNFVNENDFVTCVPMSQWGFKRYGLSTYNTAITGDLEKQWEAFTGENDYNPMSQKALNEMVSEFAKCSNNGWASCHTYTCDCHGDKTDNDIVEKGVEPYIYEEIIRYTRPSNYCKATFYERWYGRDQYQLCQTPAYFMQVLAEIMVSQYDLGFNGMAEKATEVIAVYSLADKYESARNKVVVAAARGIEHQHYTESYYIIDQNVTASSFR